MIKEIEVYCVESAGSKKWEDDVYMITGFYKGVMVVQREYPAKQGAKLYSAAVFVSRVRNEINKNYHKKGA
jgi:hypothetical protein